MPAEHFDIMRNVPIRLIEITLREGGEIVRLDGVAVLAFARDALADGDAGAVDEDALLPVRLADGGERGIDVGLAW